MTETKTIYLEIPLGEFERLHAEIKWLRTAEQRRTEEIQTAMAEVQRLRTALDKGRALVEDMDLRMPEQATEDADGWINSYRIPVGPWHRLLGWARGGA